MAGYAPMAADDSVDTILKILSGVQSGVDIALADGEYTLGNGDDDDIQLFDVSLLPQHLKLSIQRGKIKLAGAAGSATTRNGVTLEAASDFHEIEPLDIVSAGTSRVVLGGRTANWASITSADTSGEAEPDAAPRSRPIEPAAFAALVRSPRMLVTALLVALLLTGAFGTGYLSRGAGTGYAAASASANDYELVQQALAGFTFRPRLEIREELDGTIYISGYVDAPVERRAILAAVRDSGVPARARVAVLDLISNEVRNLLLSENADLDFTVTEDGVVILTGVMLDPTRAAAIVEMLRERVTGIFDIDSQIRSGPSILSEVQQLAERSQISPLVILRLDNDLIEASGILPRDKIDAWAGFLQAYASRFASIIPLRSVVALETAPVGGAPGTLNAPNVVDGPALYLGSGVSQAGERGLDIARVTSGQFELADIFVNQQDAASPQPAALPTSQAHLTPQGYPAPQTHLMPQMYPTPEGISSNAVETTASRPLTPLNLDRIFAPARGGAITPSDTASPAQGERQGQRLPIDSPGEATPGVAATSDPAVPIANDPTEMGRRLVENWRGNTLDDEDPDTTRLLEGLRELDTRGRQSMDAPANDGSVEQRYAPMLARLPRSMVGQQCWPGSRLTDRDVVGTVFWLDLISVSNMLSVTSLGTSVQPLLLEAALNPDSTATCLNEATDGAMQSIYLHEISNNQGFVRHLIRDLDTFPLDIAGVSIGNSRYIQIRDGMKLRQGSAPDETSRLAIVGELGVVVQRSNGYAASIFDDTLNWRTR